MKALYTLLLVSVLSVSIFAAEKPTTILSEGQQYLENQQIAFEENKGQVTGEDGAKVKFTYQANGLSLFLLPTGIAYQFNKIHYPEGYIHLDKFATSEEQQEMEKLAEKIRVETYRMDVNLVGANPNAEITTQGKSKDYIQYYNHNALDVYSFAKVTYHNIYPNIDWVIYKKGESIKYDFIVRPGGDPDQIKLQTTDAENIELDQEGNLSLSNRMGTITEDKPISYQNDNEVYTEFVIQDAVISFKVEEYNKDEELIIDPVLGWATYYGGTSYDEGFSCVVDDSGNVYLAGATYSTSNIASGGYQDTIGGTQLDDFLVKFNALGVRLWATYYGGSGVEFSPWCSVDDSGNVYLSGHTNSSTNIASAGHQNLLGGGAGDSDAFLVKFNSIGTRLWATYYGGSNSDFGTSCSVDDSGNVYLAGRTLSSLSIASGGHQNTFGGGIVKYDAFLVKFNSTGTRLWATYYGGINDDRGVSCSVDDSGNVYLAGLTISSANIASGGHQNIYGGGYGDAFLVKFNTLGIRLWATYYGGSGDDFGVSCTIDDSGNVYLAGLSDSSINMASGGYQNTYGGGSFDAFLVKFTSAGVRLWDTYYGGSGSDGGYSCDVDDLGNVYLAGFTTSTSNIESGGYQNAFGGGYLVKFDSSGSRLWATYYGGTGSDIAYSCAVNDSVVYLAGFTYGIPNIGSGGHQSVNGGGGDAFMVKFLCGHSIVDTQTACNSYTWINGVTYTASNDTATQTYTNVSGCDSVVTLNLTIQSNTGTDIQTACDSYTWINGITYTSSNNIATDTLTNVNGCDSIVTLNLTINYPNTGIDTQIAV